MRIATDGPTLTPLTRTSEPCAQPGRVGELGAHERRRRSPPPVERGDQHDDSGHRQQRDEPSGHRARLRVVGGVKHRPG